MALPHPLYITGLGFDSGELFYGCTTPLDVDGPPGSGSRGVAPGEDSLSTTFNRISYALAKNVEYLYDIFEAELAYTEVGALTTFTGNSIDVDMTGGWGGDVNYTGFLYLGEAGWTTQEFIDTLFQILDENYNEVMVGDVEARVTSITGAALGTGFFNSNLVTLNLNVTLPSGNYRLVYPRGASFEDLPAYSLIRADIRGLQEDAAETVRRSVHVIGPANDPEGVDYAGPTAIQDALAALGDGCVLFVKAGTYTLYQAGTPNPLTISQRDVTIIGEGEGQVTLQVADGHLLTVTGQRLTLMGVTVAGGTNTAMFTTTGSIRIEDCTFDALCFACVPGNLSSIRNVQVTNTLPFISSLTFSNSQNVSVENVTIAAPTGSGSPFIHAVSLVQCSSCSLTNVRFANAAFGYHGLQINSASECTFDSCVFDTIDLSELEYSAIAQNRRNTLRSCVFRSNVQVVEAGGGGVLQKVQYSFHDCLFENTAIAEYQVPFVAFSAGETGGEEYGIVLDNCIFRDAWCRGRDGGGTNHPVIELVGVHARNMTVDRTGASKMYQYGAHVEMTRSRVDGLYVKLDCTVIDPGLPGAPNAGPAMLDVLDNSVLRNVHISGVEGYWIFSAFHLQGSRVDFGLDVPHYAMVEGVTILPANPGTSTWGCYRPQPGGVLAHLEEVSIFRRAFIGDTCRFQEDSANGASSLIEIGGDDVEVSDCNFVIPDGWFDYLIYGGSVQRARIERNSITLVKGHFAVDLLNTCHQPIWLNGGGNHHIHANYIRWFGEFPEENSAAPPVVTWALIGLAATVRDTVISGNVLESTTTDNGGPPNNRAWLMKIYGVDSAGGAPSQNNNTYGNTLTVQLSPNSIPGSAYYAGTTPPGDVINNGSYWA